MRLFRRHALRPGTLLIVAFTLLAVGRLSHDYLVRGNSEFTVAALEEGEHDVMRVVDGFNLILAKHHPPGEGPVPRARVRLLGVQPMAPDDPQSQAAWMERATDVTRRMVSGKTVRVRLDRRRIDQDGNLLAYIAVGDRMLNEHLVRQGLARVSAQSADSTAIVRQLRQAQHEARLQGRGAWSVRRL